MGVGLIAEVKAGQIFCEQGKYIVKFRPNLKELNIQTIYGRDKKFSEEL